MNSIVLTHFGAPSRDACLLEAALCRLGAWLDAEQETLGRVLAQSRQKGAASALDALMQLHLEPNVNHDELRALLEGAQTYLEILLETLRRIPYRCRVESAWGLPGPASFDAHVRWSAARLEDILATLRHCLAA